MFPLTETRFLMREYDWGTAFVRDDSGRVTALSSWNGAPFKKIR